MKYLVTGSNYQFDTELINNALEDLNEHDTVLMTASTILEDQVAQIAFEVGASLKTKSPDNSLRGNSSCLLYTSPSPRDRTRSRMPSSA